MGSETADSSMVAGEVSGAWLKRMMSIKDSAAIFHKDFKAARSSLNSTITDARRPRAAADPVDSTH